MRTMRDLNLEDTIEDILITLGKHYHLIRPVRSVRGDGLFLYLALQKDSANLALARRQLQIVEGEMQI